MEINKRAIKKIGRSETLFSKAVAFLVIWGIIIPLIVAAVVASWALLLDVVGIK